MNKCSIKRGTENWTVVLKRCNEIVRWFVGEQCLWIETTQKPVDVLNLLSDFMPKFTVNL